MMPLKKWPMESGVQWKKRGSRQSAKSSEKIIHKPVMLKEVIDGLNIQPSGIYIDATLGRAGHAQVILSHLNEAGRLLVIDKDPEAITHAEQLFKQNDRVVIKQGGFAKITQFCEELGWMNKVQGILLDLGVSSPQLDQANRGFSFQQSGPLDMRMDTTQGQSAATWINQAKETEIAEVLKIYGEEKFYQRIARAIVNARQHSPIHLTTQLAEIIAEANPAWEKRKHPATRSFQAIRIFINDELAELKSCLEQSLAILAPEGRLVVLSFHSLEDRIVKQFIAHHVREINSKQLISVVKKFKASNDEVADNPRARSALLRVAEKISAIEVSPQDKFNYRKALRMKKQTRREAE